jgi:hypothetical protein
MRVLSQCKWIAFGKAEEIHQFLQLPRLAVHFRRGRGEFFGCRGVSAVSDRGDFVDQFGSLPDRQEHFTQQGPRAFGESDRIVGKLADSLGGDLRALGKFADFGGDDGEALAMLAARAASMAAFSASRLVW